MSIKIENVTYVYDNKHKALENINLEINSGDFVGIIGASGARKIYINKTSWQNIKANFRNNMHR